jgi:hypothetical protein
VEDASFSQRGRRAIEEYKRSQIESLAGAERSEFDRLSSWFASRRANDPDGWAISEVHEDIPQQTRFLFLRGVWRNMHETADDALASERAVRLMRDGADPTDLRLLIQHALCSLAFNLIYLIDEPDGSSWQESDGHFASDVAPSEPRWALTEISPDGRPTDRAVRGLHESLLDTDPAGPEGEGWT